MQSICSLYIHRIYAVPNQKMASIYPGQRLFPFFYWVRHPWKRNVQSKTRAPEHQSKTRATGGSEGVSCWRRRRRTRRRTRRRRRRRRRFTGGGRCSDAVLVVRRRTVKVKSMHRATSPDDSVLSTSSNSSDNIRQYIRQYQTISDNTRGTPAGSRQADDQSCAVARPVRRRQLR